MSSFFGMSNIKDYIPSSQSIVNTLKAAKPFITTLIVMGLVAEVSGSSCSEVVTHMFKCYAECLDSLDSSGPGLSRVLPANSHSSCATACANRANQIDDTVNNGETILSYGFN